MTTERHQTHGKDQSQKGRHAAGWPARLCAFVRPVSLKPQSFLHLRLGLGLH